MRVAAVALVLIVGAAVVLAFANTLNSWVLGGLLGGLAAILLSIPISLALFTLLARRHDASRRAGGPVFEDEPVFADEFCDEPEGYEARSYLEEGFSPDPRARASSGNRRPPVSGYLPLPPADQDWEAYDDVEAGEHRDPRNYPRHPRYLARSPGQNNIQPSPARSYRDRSTRSLAQHQSAARRQAREEAQRPANRSGSSSLERRSQETYTPSSLRPRSPGQMPPRGSSSSSRRPPGEYGSRHTRQPGTRSTSWYEQEDATDDFSTEQLRARYPQAPRRRGYRLNPRASRSRAIDPWTGTLEDDDEQEEPLARRPRPDGERLSGSLRNPLVRRAPYLYEDDPMREELARQLNNERPPTRRSSLYEDEEEY